MSGSFDLVHRVVTLCARHAVCRGVDQWQALSCRRPRESRRVAPIRIRFARGRGLSAWVAQEGRAVVIPDPAAREKRTAFADETLRAFLAFPLVQQGVVSGGRGLDPHGQQPSQKTSLTAWAQLAAAAGHERCPRCGGKRRCGS